MIFLYSTISSLKSIFGMVVIPSPSFSSYCPCWTSGTFLCSVLLLVLRLVLVVVLWFALPAVGYALLLPAVGFALLPAVGFALLGSFHHRSRYSCSSRCPRTPCCFTSFFSPQARWMWFRLGFSPLALWLWFRLGFFFRVTLW